MRREWATASAILIAATLWTIGHRWIESHETWTPYPARSPLAGHARQKGIACEPLAASSCEMPPAARAALASESRRHDEAVAETLQCAIDRADRGDIAEASRLCKAALRMDDRVPLAREILRDLRATGRLNPEFRATHVQTWLATRVATASAATPRGN